MRFTLNQLKKYLKTDKTPCELEKAMTMLGLEIEEMIDKSSPISEFIVGEIVECSKHEDSDHLHLLKVNTGEEITDIVCSAPNVRKGLFGILARPGNIIPHTGIKFKKGIIRGKESNCMMCSVYELELGTDHDGIIDIPLELGAKAGDNALDVLAKMYPIDVVYDAEVTPNRPDYLGVMGIARDLYAGGHGEFITPVLKEVKGEFSSKIKVKNEITEDAKEFNIRYIKGVKNGPPPKWLTDYLTSVEMKTISALVDITNYSLHNICRPLHVFDADKIKGDLVINYAKHGEKFTGLDGNEYTLAEGDIVIRDDNGIQSLAGIIGGLDTACTMDTTNVILESAYFNPLPIRKTAKRLGVESDAKYRFERGIDMMCTVWGMDFATNLITDICGGTPSDIIKTGVCAHTQTKIDFPISYFSQLIGFDMEKKTMIEILKKLGCEVSDLGESLCIIPPSFRNDLMEKHDITEELIRIHGYDKLPSISVTPSSIKPVLSADDKRRCTLPRILAARGLTEVYTWSFMSDKKEFNVKKSITISNPITSELNVMRQSIIPNLIDGVASNIVRSHPTSNLFEVGPVFYGKNPGEQHLAVSGVRAGLSEEKNWDTQAKIVSVFDIKEDIFAVLKHFGIESDKIKYTTEDLPSWLHPYKSAGIIFGNKLIGYFGEISPITLKKFGVKNTTIVAFEINIDLLPLAKDKKTTAKKKIVISDLQPISRDFAFIVDMDTKADEILKSVKKFNELISSAKIFDIYTGDKLPKGKKSMAINITIQATLKTLTDEEIQNISNAVIVNITGLGGELRDK